MFVDGCKEQDPKQFIQRLGFWFAHRWGCFKVSVESKIPKGLHVDEGRLYNGIALSFEEAEGGNEFPGKPVILTIPGVPFQNQVSDFR